MLAGLGSLREGEAPPARLDIAEGVLGELRDLVRTGIAGKGIGDALDALSVLDGMGADVEWAALCGAASRRLASADPATGAAVSARLLRQVVRRAEGPPLLGGVRRFLGRSGWSLHHLEVARREGDADAASEWLYEALCVGRDEGFRPPTDEAGEGADYLARTIERPAPEEVAGLVRVVQSRWDAEGGQVFMSLPFASELARQLRRRLEEAVPGR